MTDQRRSLGRRGEDAAAAYLERSGMTVIERNWRGVRGGEVDIVALDGDTIVFCEVKTRRSCQKGAPDEAITAAKQRRYARLAAEYLRTASLGDVPARFDVISLRVIAPDRALLRHHRGAFTLPPA